MKAFKFLLFFLGLVVIVIIIGALALPGLNDYQKEGSLTLKGLKKPVSVHRDEKGMAYIRSDNLEDAIMAQGFVTAQDRLFQMQLTRMMAQGRISELAGEKARSLDIMMRTIGVHRNAKEHAKILDEKTRKFFQKYIDGVNQFIETRKDSIHLEFKLAGIEPEKWSVTDSLSIMYYMGWTTSANVNTEIISQMLVERLGKDKAGEIFPININPDAAARSRKAAQLPVEVSGDLGLSSDKSFIRLFASGPRLGSGSNNWAVAPEFSPNGKPVVADDPHLDARILPGVWYPLGIITPETRAVGVMIPGIPGMIIGRTDKFAMGVTNAYGDCQDLYIETVDPKNEDNYLEGEESIGFETKSETLKIKDKSQDSGFREETVEIRFTKRGPVVSRILPGLETDKVITLRWAAKETMRPSIGLHELITAGSTDEVRQALENITFIVLNCVFGDTQGNIGWHVSGRLPIRTGGESLTPHVVKDGNDNWTGWIPFNEMPNSENPEKGWLGTCNHKTVTEDYPYYYSSYFATSFRYRRLKELLEAPGMKTIDDHWRYQRDTKNIMAQNLAPVYAKILMKSDDTKGLGKILSNWNHRDDPDQSGPTIFQLTHRNLAYSVFQDELGDDITDTMIHHIYYWQERLQNMILSGESPWFDNKLTEDKKETLSDLVHQAALEASKTLGAEFGDDPRKWLWGEAHQIEFVNPIRRNGFGKSLVGGMKFPMGGSSENLYCAWYDYRKPLDVVLSASLRMVADLGDDEKVLAVLPGGVTGRTFDEHLNDQVPKFMKGDKVYWWFSDEAINKHTKNVLTLNPTP